MFHIPCNYIETETFGKRPNEYLDSIARGWDPINSFIYHFWWEYDSEDPFRIGECYIDLYDSIYFITDCDAQQENPYLLEPHLPLLYGPCPYSRNDEDFYGMMG